MFCMHSTSGEVEQVKDKYATGGYGNYPSLIQKKFEKELSEFKKQCDELTLEEVIKVCNTVSS